MQLSIQPYDFVMLAVLAGCTAFGAWKGMAWQVAAIASVLVSVIVATRASGALAPLFGQQEPWNYAAAMLVLYVATSFIIWLAFRGIAKVINRVQLKEFDRQLGATFGLARGVLWCLIITFFVVTLSESGRQKVLRSYTGYYAAIVVHRATPLLPTKLRETLGAYIQKLNDKLDPTTPPDSDPNARVGLTYDGHPRTAAEYPAAASGLPDRVLVPSRPPLRAADADPGAVSVEGREARGQGRGMRGEGRVF